MSKQTHTYSLRQLERLLGINRSRLLGRIEALGIRIVEGPRKSKRIDEAGYRRLVAFSGFFLPASVPGAD